MATTFALSRAIVFVEQNWHIYCPMKNLRLNKVSRDALHAAVRASNDWDAYLGVSILI